MIAWVHGALSSDRSFNYLRERLPAHERLVFQYSVRAPLADNLAELEKLLRDNVITGMVGHSLGGVMAALMMKRLGIPKAVTLSSPFAGSMMANFMPMNQMMIDIRSTSPLFKELSDYKFDDRLLSIVTTGLEASYPRSDGVVAVQSQIALRGNRLVELPLNHFEVLLDHDVAQHIREHLFG